MCLCAYTYSKAIVFTSQATPWGLLNPNVQQTPNNLYAHTKVMKDDGVLKASFKTCQLSVRDAPLDTAGEKVRKLIKSLITSLHIHTRALKGWPVTLACDHRRDAFEFSRRAHWQTYSRAMILPTCLNTFAHKHVYTHTNANTHTACRGSTNLPPPTWHYSLMAACVRHTIRFLDK